MAINSIVSINSRSGHSETKDKALLNLKQYCMGYLVTTSKVF